MSSIIKHRKFGKIALALLLSSLILIVSVLEASPSLHKLIHPDANSPSHNCVVSLFAKGQITPAPAALILAAFVSLVGAIALLAETLVLPSADYRFSASRAPPSSSSRF